MKHRAFVASFSWIATLGLMRLVSLCVPARHRVSWRKEWHGELWQIHVSSRSHIDLLRFAAGALPDAVCLLLAEREEPTLRAVPAPRCICMLTALALLLTAVAWSFPPVRAEFRQTEWVSPQNLSVLFLPNDDNEAAPTVTAERFLLWKQRAPFLQKIGFYQITDHDVIVRGRLVRLHVAHIAGALATMIGESNLLQQNHSSAPNRMILSRRAWRRYFQSERSIEGGIATVDGLRIRVTALAELEDSGLPGDYDAWLFDNRPLQLEQPGFVIASFADGTPVNPYFGFEHFSIRETPDCEISGLAVPVADRKPNTWSTLGLGLALSLLALPATTPLGFGQKARAHGPASVVQVFHRWLFFSLKCVLCAALASDSALIVASVFSRADWRFAVVTRSLVAFFVMLVSLRWIIHDQRRRCPVCLRQLTKPARVGEPSRNFLSWNGTELVCESGHGLMHVPAHATSWFSTQRWQALDSSWQFLFAHKR